MTITFELARPSVLSQPKESELTLLDAARQMDRKALIEIFDRYSSAIYAYAFRLSQDARLADYIVGDVFAKLLDQFSAGNGPTSNLRSYLYEMTYHLVVDQARYADRVVPYEALDITHHDGFSSFVKVENKLLFENILLAVQNRLTKDQRHVIMLRFLEGLSLSETAEVLGKDVNNVKVIQNRAIATLRKVLENKDSK